MATSPRNPSVTSSSSIRCQSKAENILLPLPIVGNSPTGLTIAAVIQLGNTAVANKLLSYCRSLGRQIGEQKMSTLVADTKLILTNPRAAWQMIEARGTPARD